MPRSTAQVKVMRQNATTTPTRQGRNTGVRMSEATPKPRTKKNAGFNNFLTEHREEIEYRLRREMGAGAKITKRAVNSEARSAWESLDEDERRVYSL